MPRKICQLIADLERAGFIYRGEKGNHRNSEHPRGLRVTISGKQGSDALPYQEKEVKKKINASDYLKIVEWSEQDNCFIGSAPPLIGPCCHGKSEEAVYRELKKIVAEWIELYQKDGKVGPHPSAGKEYRGKFVLRVDPELHHLLSVRALQEGDSLNTYCAKLLKKTSSLET